MQPEVGLEPQSAGKGTACWYKLFRKQGREVAVVETCHHFPTSIHRSTILFPTSLPWERQLYEISGGDSEKLEKKVQ